LKYINYIYSFFCILIFSLNISFALPRFSVLNGASCIVCHVNPTGSGLRNSHGNDVVALEELPLERWLNKGNEDWDGFITDNIQVGGDFRLQAIQYDNTDSTRNTSIFPMQAEIYTYVTLNSYSGIYAKIGIPKKGEDANTEYWALINNLPNNTWLRLGKSLPNYGLRIDDHTSFIRGGNTNKTLLGLPANIEGLLFTPYIYLAPPTIIELGVPISNALEWTGSISTSLIGSNNKLNNITSQLMYLSTMNENIKYMASISYMNENTMSMIGVSGGITYRNLTWTFEIDQASNWIENYTSIAFYDEIAWEVIQGFHLIGKYDFFDPKTEIQDGAINRFTLGAEIYPLSILEIKLQARFNQIDMENSTKKNPEYLLQTHLYF
tara:strand:+ start:2388 stop:3527 length:1140 start_codon:yes stop_codon:yes gene_type:complete